MKVKKNSLFLGGDGLPPPRLLSIGGRKNTLTMQPRGRRMFWKFLSASLIHSFLRLSSPPSSSSSLSLRSHTR